MRDGPRRAWEFSVATAITVALLACGAPEPECPQAPAVPKCIWDGPRVCPAVLQFDPASVSDPPLRLALEALRNMFDENVEPVRGLFTPELALELPREKMLSIVRGLVDAHGAPVQIIDAWRTEVREKEVRLPAAQVLLRMSNEVRVSLLLVFTPSGAVRGFWLRPI